MTTWATEYVSTYRLTSARGQETFNGARSFRLWKTGSYMMGVSREEFARRYKELLHMKFHAVHSQAIIDDEYESYRAIADFVGAEGDIDLVRARDGEVHVIVTPRFDNPPADLHRPPQR